MIFCKLNTDQRPHDSGHVDGTVNVVETAECTPGTQKITVTAYLYPPVPYVTVTGKPGYGRLTAKSNAARPCTPGKYQGYGYVTFDFPPGYSPATISAGRFGPTADIRCD
jgi:hypothetical protein